MNRWTLMLSTPRRNLFLITAESRRYTAPAFAAFKSLRRWAMDLKNS
jgi:hypothetical protein